MIKNHSPFTEPAGALSKAERKSLAASEFEYAVIFVLQLHVFYIISSLTTQNFNINYLSVRQSEIRLSGLATLCLQTRPAAQLSPMTQHLTYTFPVLRASVPTSASAFFRI